MSHIVDDFKPYFLALSDVYFLESFVFFYICNAVAGLCSVVCEHIQA